ncbi:GNAT family N-acetyltransferase [Taibaiella koreensis]|uniref:GNAT family N-acetyltransferase n=1 Tax=Taibaiella koreensis TaxID=1268548 RepID=UPI000E59DAA6|nr:GNAT family N-acetyltransferase [Taibaiella koreensis]
MIETPFIPFPELTTNRLLLRQLEAGDKLAIFAHRSNDEVNTWLDDFRHSSVEQTEAFINRVQGEIARGQSILWVLTQKGDPAFMGTICLWNISKEQDKAEIGYTLDPAHHRMGYMHEALVKVIDFGWHTMKLQQIEAYTHERNAGSIRLLIKNHFRQQAKPQKPVPPNRVFFTLTKDKG